MNYIVFDLEWNQSNTGREPECAELPFEIIDIGAIKLNEQRQMVGEFNHLVKPKVYSRMHNITSKIIHLHMQDLMRGQAFPTVMREFRKFCTDECIFCTWGNLDLFELQRNMRFFGLEPLSNGPLRFLDIQKLYSLSFEDGKTRRSLEYAIDALKLDKDIPFHRAFSDAYYTAKIMSVIPEKMLKYWSFDTFRLPVEKKDELHIRFDEYEKYISREFQDRHAAMTDREVASTKCFMCNKPVKKKVRWFSPNGGKHYYSIAECPTHGYTKFKVRIKKTEAATVYVVKTSKPVGEEKAAEYAKKRQQIMEKRTAGGNS